MTGMVSTCNITGSVQRPDGSAATDITLRITPVAQFGGSWAADAVLTDSIDVTPDVSGNFNFNLVAGAYFRLVIMCPGQRPQPYTVATPVSSASLDLMEMIAVGRYGWGPPGNMPMPGWGFGPGWF